MNSIKCHLILIIYVLLITLQNGTSTNLFVSSFNNNTAELSESDIDFLALTLEQQTLSYLNKTTTFNAAAAPVSTTLSENSLVRKLILSFICVPIIVATLVGNMLVILAVIIVRKLHTQDNANNFLIVSLALSDFLVGILVMPFAFYVEISEENKWYLGSILCDLWTISDVLLCTASILNLCAISIDRYFIILHSFKYTQKRNKKLMFLMIVIVWLISAVISIPPLFGWGRKPKELECSVSDDLKYQIYATMLAFYVPSFLMIIVYVNIYRAANKIKKREMQTAGRLQTYLNTPALHYDSIQTNNNKSNCSTNNNNNNNNLNTKKTSFMLRDLRSNPSAHFQSIDSGSTTKKSESNPILSNELCPSTTTTTINTTNGGNLANRLGRRVTQAILNIKCHQSNMPVSKNQKATLTLGVIMGCFILCWLPFFILAILKPVYVTKTQKLSAFIPKWLDSFLLWLGYLNSALNPVIYARFNREFRRPFIEILCFRCKNINAKLRDEERKKVWAGMPSMRSADAYSLNSPPQLQIDVNKSVSFNSINRMPLEQPLLNSNNNDTTQEEHVKRKLSERVDSTIEIETIKEKFFTIKLNDENSSPSYIHLNETNKSTQLALTNNATDSTEQSNLSKHESIHSLFEQLLNSETNSDKSRLSITVSSLNSFRNTLPALVNANTIVLTTTQTTLTTELDNSNLKHDESDVTLKNSTPLRSKTSKKRKLHSNYSKLVSDSNFKKHSSRTHQRLAYCTYNNANGSVSNGKKQLSKRVCLSPSIISRIATYANNGVNGSAVSSKDSNKLNAIGSPPTSYESSPSSAITTTTATSSSSSSSSSSTSSEYYNSNLSPSNNHFDQSIKSHHNLTASYLDFKTSPKIIASESCV